MIRVARAVLAGSVVTSLLAAAAPAPAVPSQPVQFAKVDGATLGFRTAGSGPGKALLLISGSSNTMAEWDPRLLDELATSRRVIVFDNRGAGTSTGDVSRLTIAQMARDTAQLIDQVGGGPLDVLGWSMGGYIAQELAIRFPGRVHRLVLASTDCGGPSTIGPTPAALKILIDPNATTKQRMSILFPKNRMGAAAAWQASVGEAFAANGYQPANSFAVTAKTAQAQARAAGPLWLGPGMGTCSRLGRIKAPTLVSGGVRDIVVPIVNRKALTAGIAGAQGRVYPDAGHAFLFQPGLRFGAEVTSFLAEPT